MGHTLPITFERELTSQPNWSSLARERHENNHKLATNVTGSCLFPHFNAGFCGVMVVGGLTAVNSALAHTHTRARGKRCIKGALLHLVVRRLSTSRSSCSSTAAPRSCSGTEFRQLPPAEHQQVNQRPQPYQHRHGHRQPPTETLHFPVRRSRRRPQPRLLSELHFTATRKQVKQAQASGQAAPTDAHKCVRSR